MGDVQSTMSIIILLAKAGKRGQFEDVDAVAKRLGATSRLSPAGPGRRQVSRSVRLAGDYDEDWHSAPQGRSRVIASKRRWTSAR